MSAEFPQTLSEAVKYFSNEETSHAFLCALRWPDGKPRCAHCDSLCVGNLCVSRRKMPASKLKPERVITRRLWNCKNCKKQFTAILGTVFEASPLGLDVWFTAIWMLTNCKNGISSYEIARSLGITQKSAWFVLHRVRRILHDGSLDKLAGEIEADESFIGGKARNMHQDRRAKYKGRWDEQKTPVMAVLERGTRTGVMMGVFGKPEKTASRIRVKVIKNTTPQQIQPFVMEHVARGSQLMTDEQASYRGMENLFVHQFVNHAVTYVQGTVHTNGLENFWCLLKRSLKGTYVCPQPFHMWRYLDEQAYRFNQRKMECFDRFAMALSSAPGKRLTWNKLTAKDEMNGPSAASETFSL